MLAEPITGPTVLITGTNRGIGLALVKQFLEKDWLVHACCRQPDNADELTAISSPSLSIHTLDILQEESITQLKSRLKGIPIDLLINNAGILGDREHSTFGNINYNSWETLFRVNTMGPIKMLEALIDNLVASKQKHVVSITSGLASISNSEGYMLPYSSSKAALNSVMKSLSIELKEQGIRVNVLSPGWVQTNMGGPEAPLSTQESASLLYRNIENLTATSTGLFIGHEGDIYPW